MPRHCKYDCEDWVTPRNYFESVHCICLAHVDYEMGKKTVVILNRKAPVVINRCMETFL